MKIDINKVLKQASEQAAQMQEDLAKVQTEASSGGGMVTAVVNGQQEVVSIKFEKEVVDPEDVEMLQDLVVAALNEALRKSKEVAAEKLSKITGGIKIPGLNL